MNNRPLVIQVEDDPNDIFLFDRAFKKAAIDADLKAFEDGENLISFLTSAAQSAGAVRPRIVLLDIKLPRKSGFEVLQWIRAHPAFRRLPVVMLTSSSQQPDVRRAYDLGANGYVVKPMDIEDTTKLITAVNAFWLTVNVEAIGADVPQLTPAQV